MKKIAIAAALVLLTVFAVSCKKEKKPADDSAPTIECEANASFAEFELVDNMNADVVVNSKQGLKTVTIKFTTFPPIMGNGFINTNISIKANQGTSSSLPTLDLVDDATALAWVKGMNLFSNSSLQNATTVTFHFDRLVNAMLHSQTLENNNKLAFKLTVTDVDDQSVSKTLTFHFTAAPEITIKNQSFVIDAPGKIEKAVLLVSKLSTTLTNKLTGPVYNGVAKENGIELDLINNATAVDKLATFNVSTGSKLNAETKATIDLSKFISDMVMEEIATDAAYGDHTFTLTIQDALGKSATEVITYKYEAPAN